MAARWQCVVCDTLNAAVATRCYICDAARSAVCPVAKPPARSLAVIEIDDISDSPQPPQRRGPVAAPQKVPSTIIVGDDDDDGVVIVESPAEPVQARARPTAPPSAVAATGVERRRLPDPLPASASDSDDGAYAAAAGAASLTAAAAAAPLAQKRKRPARAAGALTDRQLEQQRQSVEHALQRAAIGKLSAFETAVCVRPAVLESEAGRLLVPALGAASYAVLPPVPADPQRPNVVTWHRLALDVHAIAHAAAAKTGGTLAAASSAAALIDVQRAVSSAAAGVAGSAVSEPYAAVVWPGSEYLRVLVEGGTDGLEALIADVREGVAGGGAADAPPCQVVFIVEGLSRALAAVDQRGAAARYVTADAVEHAHMHLYMRCALEVAETGSPAETADHLVTMTRAIAEKPYKARTAAFAHVLKKKTRAAAFAAAGSAGSAAGALLPDPEALFAGGVGAGAGGSGDGTSTLDTWLGALQMIPSLSEAKAVRVAAAYPTLRSLRRAFLAADPATAPRLLEDVFDGRRKLAKLSSILHTFLTQRAPDEAAAEE